MFLIVHAIFIRFFLKKYLASSANTKCDFGIGGVPQEILPVHEELKKGFWFLVVLE
jgi:hypothetical protein